MNNQSFGIKHKISGLWFGGFDAAQDVVWVDEASAKPFDKLTAQMQATLLSIYGYSAQRKPIPLAA